MAILGTKGGSEVYKSLGTYGLELIDNKAYDDMRSICAFSHLMEQPYG